MIWLIDEKLDKKLFLREQNMSKKHSYDDSTTYNFLSMNELFVI